MGSVLNMDRLRDEWVRRAPEVSYCNPDDPLLRQVMIRAVELVTGQPRLQRIYNDFNRACPEQDDFWVSAVEWLRLTVNYNAQQLDAIPSEDPLIVIANHPYGVVDGIAVSYLTSLVRKDIKLLAHATLGRAGALRPFLIPIEFEGDSSALRSNVESKRTAIRHLRDGGALVIFPAGQVSTAPRVFDQAVDAPWKLFAGKLVATSQATVVPVFFEGQNSLLFHLVSRFSTALREALLLRELAKRIGADVTAHIGVLTSFEELADWSDRHALVEHLRDMVYSLDPDRDLVPVTPCPTD